MAKEILRIHNNNIEVDGEPVARVLDIRATLRQRLEDIVKGYDDHENTMEELEDMIDKLENSLDEVRDQLHQAEEELEGIHANR
jgi:predicted  nucleic acid-binding Zn-ribbon protein